MARYVDLDKVKEFRISCNTTSMLHCDRNCAECFYNYGGGENITTKIYAHWTEKEWAEEFDNRLISNYECSNCKDWLRDKTLYCPSCGAKMDKE